MTVLNTTQGILTAQPAELGAFVENVLVSTVAPRLGPAGITSTVLVRVLAFLCQPTTACNATIVVSCDELSRQSPSAFKRAIIYCRIVGVRSWRQADGNSYYTVGT